MPKGRSSTVPILLGLGLALGAGYYLMNPAAAQHDSEKIKETSQRFANFYSYCEASKFSSYGNKFDKAVDDAMAQAKTYGKDAEKDLKKSFEDIKTKAGNFADDASAEAQKKFADAKAEVTKLTEDTKVSRSRKSK